MDDSGLPARTGASTGSIERAETAEAASTPGLARAFLAWATRRDPRAGSRPTGRIERLVAIVVGLVSVAALGALASTIPPVEEPSRPAPTQPPSGRGDPFLAQQLADRARQASAQDPLHELRLLLAAHTVDPDNVNHRTALAERVLTWPDGVTATSDFQTTLDAGEPITFAALSADASYLVTSGSTRAQIWQTAWIADPPRIQLAAELTAPVSAAAGVGELSRTNLVIADSDGVSQWTTANRAARHVGPLAARADTVAITTARDRVVAVTVDGSTATLWDVTPVGSEAQATLTYHQPTTALAFAPGSTRLAAGHADGAVTVYTIGFPDTSTTKSLLTTGNGPVDTVAISADASTALGVHRNGDLNVWDLDTEQTKPVGTAAGAAGPGPHQAWLSPTGDFALVADTAGPAALWSLAEPTRPHRVLGLPGVANPSVPTMLSVDGHIAVTIDQANVLTIWNLDPIMAVIDAPTDRACKLAGLDHQVWRQLVPNEAFANPCQPSAPPNLDPTPTD